MKVGNLVQLKYVYADDELDMQEKIEKNPIIGIILQLSKTGHTTYSARVRFTNGMIDWYDSRFLEIL
jgi:hypothetical protein